MKTIILIFLPFLAFTQLDIDTKSQSMVAMSETTQEPYEVGTKYFAKNATKPYTGILYGKHANGNYSTMQEYKNGIGNGVWINYFATGKVEEKGTYVDNRVEGPTEQYYPNGKLKAKGTYKHWRKKVGEWIYYDENGIEIRRIDHD